MGALLTTRRHKHCSTAAATTAHVVHRPLHCTRDRERCTESCSTCQLHQPSTQSMRLAAALLLLCGTHALTATGPQPVVWSLAGSDSSAGAGVEADLRAFRCLGARGCAVVTALTAQSTTGVEAVLETPAAHVAATIAALEADLPPAAVKTGALGGAGAARAVAAFLRRAPPGCKVVVDPVVVSTRRVDDTVLAPGHAYAVVDGRSLNGERYCRLRDPRGGRPATDAGAALAGDAPLARGERWVPFSEVLGALGAIAVARLSSPRGAPWAVARARALTGGPTTKALRVECDRATLLRCAVHQEEDLTDLGVAVLDLSTDAVVAATVAGKARTADVDVTVGPGTYAVVPTGGRFLPEDGRQKVGLVVHSDVAVKASAAPAIAADLASVLFAGVTRQLDGPGRLVVAQSRGGVEAVVENTDAARTLKLRLDGTGSTNLEGHAGAMTVAVSVEPGAAAHVLSAAPVQAHAAWTWDATWCASWC